MNSYIERGPYDYENEDCDVQYYGGENEDCNSENEFVNKEKSPVVELYKLEAQAKPMANDLSKLIVKTIYECLENIRRRHSNIVNEEYRALPGSPNLFDVATWYHKKLPEDPVVQVMMVAARCMIEVNSLYYLLR